MKTINIVLLFHNKEKKNFFALMVYHKADFVSKFELKISTKTLNEFY